MGNRHADWFRQAEADLAHADVALKAGNFEWSCFAAQQAAEKAVKSLYMKLGMDAWGHTVSVLLAGLEPKTKISTVLLDSAKLLDKHYILTRYPYGFDSGIPADYYTKIEAQAAINHSKRIIRFCLNQID